MDWDHNYALPRCMRKFSKVITYYYMMYLNLQVFLILVDNVEDHLDIDFIPITVNKGNKCFIHT